MDGTNDTDGVGGTNSVGGVGGVGGVDGTDGVGGADGVGGVGDGGVWRPEGGRLAYGMQLPVQSQSTLYAESWEAAAGPADLVELARAADRYGFAYIACCEHIAIPRRLAEAMSTVWYDPVATLAHLAAVTERVRLLSHVAVVGLRHPLITAKQYATLDRLSGGRLILGVGAGHVTEEFEALGVDFARRGAVLDETVDALKAALGPEEFPKFRGGSGSRSRGWGRRRDPCRRRGRRSGWAAPRPPPYAGPRSAVTAGCRRATGANSCPRRSPSCGGCGRRPGPGSRR